MFKDLFFYSYLPDINMWKLIADSNFSYDDIIKNIHNLHMLKHNKFEFINNHSRWTMQITDTLVIVNKIYKYEYNFATFQTYCFNTLTWINKCPLVEFNINIFVYRIVTIKNLLYVINLAELKPYYIYDDTSNKWAIIDKCCFFLTL